MNLSTDHPDLVHEMLRYPDELRRAHAILTQRDRPALTTRQTEVLDFLISHRARHGCIPTYQEIAEGVGYSSKSSVYRVLHEMRERGAIAWSPGRQQTIRILVPAAAGR